MTSVKNFLAEIIESRRVRVAEAKSRRPLEGLRDEAHARRRSAGAHAFHASLAAPSAGFRLIAEFKRASPSKGVIRADLTPVEVARAYAAGGAKAISVLTEEDYFRGSLEDLSAVRESAPLPVLRKDFIFDEYQVYEAAAAGADALLLIVAALDDAALLRLRRLAEDELGMDALVEVHTEGEMLRAGASGARLIGVNNRDLQTFHVTLATSVALARHAPAGALLISESGLHTNEDLHLLQSHGYSAFLVGEALMRAPRPEQALRDLIGGPVV